MKTPRDRCGLSGGSCHPAGRGLSGLSGRSGQVIAATPEGVVLLGASSRPPLLPVSDTSNRCCPVPQRSRSPRCRRSTRKPPLETARQFVASGRHSVGQLRDLRVPRGEVHASSWKSFKPEMAHAVAPPPSASALRNKRRRLAVGLPADALGLDRQGGHRKDEPATSSLSRPPFSGPTSAHGRRWLRFSARTKIGNTVVGLHAGVDTQGCVVHSQEGHLVATVGPNGTA